MNANELADELDYCYGKEYPCPVSKEAATMLRKLDGQLAFRIDAVTKYQAKVEEQQAEIEALNELNTMLKDAIEKRIEMDANRYQWLRAEFAAGRETYLAEGIPSGESLDKYIDGKLK